MDVADHLAQLDADGQLLADAAERAGLDAKVVACDWTVRDLVTHTGGIHRWAADIVRTGADTGDTEFGRAVGTGPDDRELIAWFRDGHRALVQTLTDASEDVDAFTFLPAPSAKAFWARRQAHETGMHRADAESAAGDITPFAADFAQDGIAEIVQGFAARKSNAIDTPGVLGLAASDGPNWRITLGGEHIVAEPGDIADASATVIGRSSDLYLWLWNRPSAATVSGDELLAQQWREVRVRWS
ncbi:MAG TPA: maleylpyruvate isomerase family mycothiol-dependent enzyme [Jatrophihabitantaceae bacterium]|nr:maleylpyruvate isomerase family mycothiol-dependent enzyme [Jatrophihabitantaceae bacterium]